MPLVGEWQRPEQQAMHQAEDRGGHTNAERKGEDGDRGEAGRLRELTEGEAEVGHGS